MRTISLLLSVLSPWLIFADSAAHAAPLADVYLVDATSGSPESPARIPEGVAFDPFGADFYATSLFGGRITAIDARSGRERTFYQEADEGLAFVGVKVAPFRRIVWACALDRASTSQAPISYVYAIHIRRSAEGELVRRFDLPKPFFCNDLALDFRGNAYVTDSYGAALMRIPARGLWDANTQAEPFAQSALLAPNVSEQGVQTGMNGITVTPDGRWLIVARGTPAALLRISLDDPADIQSITLSGDAFGLLPLGAAPVPLGPDGIVFARGELYVVFGAGVQRVTFADRAYDSGVVRTSSMPALGLSTATNAYGEVYAIDSEIHLLNPASALPVELPHSIIRLPPEGFDPD